MTREDAINYLEGSLAFGEDDDSRHHNEVLEFIIKTLEQEPCEDTISRQAAIDYFVTNVGFHDEDGYPIEDTDELRKIWTEYFSGIPSAQPEPDINEVTCDNCEYSEKFVDGLILCRRTKTSHRVSASSTCGKGKREVK